MATRQRRQRNRDMVRENIVRSLFEVTVYSYSQANNRNYFSHFSFLDSVGPCLNTKFISLDQYVKLRKYAWS